MFASKSNSNIASLLVEVVHSEFNHLTGGFEKKFNAFFNSELGKSALVIPEEFEIKKSGLLKRPPNLKTQQKVLLNLSII